MNGLSKMIQNANKISSKHKNYSSRRSSDTILKNLRWFKAGFTIPVSRMKFYHKSDARTSKSCWELRHWELRLPTACGWLQNDWIYQTSDDDEQYNIKRTFRTTVLIYRSAEVGGDWEDSNCLCSHCHCCLCSVFEAWGPCAWQGHSRSDSPVQPTWLSYALLYPSSCRLLRQRDPDGKSFPTRLS